MDGIHHGLTASFRQRTKTRLGISAEERRCAQSANDWAFLFEQANRLLWRSRRSCSHYGLRGGQTPAQTGPPLDPCSLKVAITRAGDACHSPPAKPRLWWCVGRRAPALVELKGPHRTFPKRPEPIRPFRSSPSCGSHVVLIEFSRLFSTLPQVTNRPRQTYSTFVFPIHELHGKQ